MARPKKDGLDYFPFDVDFFSDKKIRRLRSKFGAKGVLTYIYLLCVIYKKGYYVDYDEDLILDISDELNISEDCTRQIINYLFSRSLLDGILAESVKVLTSASIQRRYQSAVEKRAAKRDSKSIEVESKFWVLKKEETESFIKVRPENSFPENNAYFSEKNDNNSREKCTKESKVKKSKGEESSSEPPLCTYGEFGHVKLADEHYQNLVQQYGETNIKKYIRKMDDYLETKHMTYDNCYIKLRQWLDNDNVKKEFNDGFDPEKYKVFINQI